MNLGVIESVRILHVFREVLLHLLHAFIYRIGYLYMVGTRLGDYNDSHHGYTIHLHVAFDVGRAQFGSSDITETDDAVVLFFDDQVVELFCSVHQSQSTDGKFCCISFDTT